MNTSQTNCSLSAPKLLICLVSCAITYWQSGTPTKHQPRWMSAASIFLLRPHRHSHNKVCSRERERESFPHRSSCFHHSCKTEHYWMYVRGSPRHQIPGRVRSTLRPGTHRFRIRTVKSLHSLIFRRILRGCAPRPCSITAGPPAHDESYATPTPSELDDTVRYDISHG